MWATLDANRHVTKWQGWILSFWSTSSHILFFEFFLRVDESEMTKEPYRFLKSNGTFRLSYISVHLRCARIPHKEGAVSVAMSEQGTEYHDNYVISIVSENMKTTNMTPSVTWVSSLMASWWDHIQKMCSGWSNPSSLGCWVSLCGIPLRWGRVF